MPISPRRLISRVSYHQAVFVACPKEWGTGTVVSGQQIAWHEALLLCHSIRLLLLHNCLFHCESCGPFIPPKNALCHPKRQPPYTYLVFKARFACESRFWCDSNWSLCMANNRVGRDNCKDWLRFTLEEKPQHRFYFCIWMSSILN